MNLSDFLMLVAISDNGCWLFKGKKDRCSYGVLKINNRVKMAHRVSFVLHNGDIPIGLNVLHKCDTPSCCNPNHLFLGTQQDNVKDCVAKGRHAKGTKKKNAKLNPNTIQLIKQQRELGATMRKLAAKFKVSSSRICDVVNSKAWKA